MKKLANSNHSYNTMSNERVFLFNVNSFADLTHFCIHWYGLERVQYAVHELIKWVKQDISRVQANKSSLRVRHRILLDEFKRILQMLQVMSTELEEVMFVKVGIEKMRNNNVPIFFTEPDLYKIAKDLDERESVVYLGKYWMYVGADPKPAEEEEVPDDEVTYTDILQRPPGLSEECKSSEKDELIDQLYVCGCEDNRDTPESKEARDRIMDNMIYLT